MLLQSKSNNSHHPLISWVVSKCSTTDLILTIVFIQNRLHLWFWRYRLV